MLEGLGNEHIGMDSAVIETKIPGVKLVQTTDFFYPNIDDPYLMVGIGVNPLAFVLRFIMGDRVKLPAPMYCLISMPWVSIHATIC